MSNDESGTKIAIVGMACRVPGAADVARFWDNLCAGVESIRRLTRDEMIEAGLDPADIDDPRHVPVGALIDDIESFDAAFFGIPSREAALMDPQQRVFLECAWQALEHAGCDPGRFDGAIGVFGGANFDSYLTRNLLPADVLEDKSATLATILANDKDYLATRVAYKLNLRGPALTVQSGCSTSLVAVHLASQSLLGYQCDVALAGGVAIDVARGQGYWAHEGSVFSPDGHCRAFDAGARGTVFGNGVGVVVLKRLNDALADGDTIYAVLLGSAVNNDGSTKVGFTAPSVSGQSQVIAEALGDAGVPADSIGYVEAHGTGTTLGDPIEVEALAQAFGTRAPGVDRCGIGAVKTNVGHLDSAAGIVGLIKAALALERGLLPPSLHFSKPNPAIDFERTPFFVTRDLTPWRQGTRSGWPRRAGVSSFGMGGTNAHVVLEEPVTAAVDPPDRWPQLLVWSARTGSALEQATRNLAAHVESAEGHVLANIAHTLQTGRARFAHRRWLVAPDVGDARTALARAGSDESRAVVFAGDVARVALAFAGDDAAFGPAACELYEWQPVFRRELDGCAIDLGVAATDLLAALSSDHADSTPAPRAAIAEPARFVVEYALAQVWRQWGVTPEAMFGSGVGEYVAASLAGVFSRRDALRLLAARGEASRQLTADPTAGDAVRERFAATVAGIDLSAPDQRVLSSVSGRWLQPDEATNPHYWSEQLARSMTLDAGRRAIEASGPFHVVEIAPAFATPAALLDTLGRLWAHGLDPDWPSVHGGMRRRRVALPTYPFERERHWIDVPADDAEEDPASPAAAARKRPDPADWLYVPGWKRALPVRASAAIGGRLGDRWLIFTPSSAFGEALAEALLDATEGDRLVIVRPGSGFKRSTNGDYLIDPCAAADYTRLLDDLVARGIAPTMVVHAWSADDIDRPDANEHAMEHGFYSVLRLVQALAVLGHAPLSLRLITTGADDVLGDEPLSPPAAAAVAAAKVIPQEHPHIDVACLDVDVSRALVSLDTLVERLVSDFMSSAPKSSVAYRGGTRWVPTFEPLPTDAVAEDTNRYAGKSYVVLGGLGRIGLSLAGHLSAAGARHIVLAGRSGLPARERWPAHVAAAPPGDRVSARIQAIERIEALGARVHVYEVDMSDEEALTRFFASATASIGGLDGVVVSAGVVDAQAFKPMSSLTADECARQFAPKVRGLAALDRALGDRPLDFCLVVSSLSSILGGLGYAAYAAANAFMDVFVREHNRRSTVRWVGVNWDAWRWTEAGTDVPGAALARLAMTPAEAGVVFDRATAMASADQIVVSTSSLHARLALWVSDIGARAAAAKSAVVTNAPPVDDVEDISDRSGLTATERAVIDVWQHVLGISHIERHDAFLDLGGTSLSAVQAISRIEQVLGVQVAVEELIFQTVGQLATLCDRKKAERRRVAEPAPAGTAAYTSADGPSKERR